jgi:hypothetical protein
MHVNDEQTNTQKMLEHNRAKDRLYKGSLERKIQDVCVNNIDRQESTILNCRDYSFEKLESLLLVDSGSVESEADPQILVKVKFTEKVDCHNLHFYPKKSQDVSASPPRIAKLFVNQMSLDFSDVDAAVPAISFELPFEYDEEGEKPFTVSLSGAKFSRISSIQIFLEDNFGTDFTCLGHVRIEGSIVPSYHTEFKK